jgi:hypothetical protein
VTMSPDWASHSITNINMSLQEPKQWQLNPRCLATLLQQDPELTGTGFDAYHKHTGKPNTRWPRRGGERRAMCLGVLNLRSQIENMATLPRATIHKLMILKRRRCLGMLGPYLNECSTCQCVLGAGAIKNNWRSGLPRDHSGRGYRLDEKHTHR